MSTTSFASLPAPARDALNYALSRRLIDAVGMFDLALALATDLDGSPCELVGWLWALAYKAGDRAAMDRLQGFSDALYAMLEEEEEAAAA